MTREIAAFVLVNKKSFLTKINAVEWKNHNNEQS